VTAVVVVVVVRGGIGAINLLKNHFSPTQYYQRRGSGKLSSSTRDYTREKRYRYHYYQVLT